jgi:hypothetical protein
VNGCALLHLHSAGLLHDAYRESPSIVNEDNGMNQSDVLSVSLRLAMTRLAEGAGGTAQAVQVAIMDLGMERMYEVLIPIECRAEVHHYLTERMDLSMPLDGEALVLNADEASSVIGLARGGY